MRRTVLALLLACLGSNAAIAADEAVLAPPASLAADGLPSVPRALVDEVGRYTEYRSAGFVDWHPVEHQLLISTRFANTTQIHRVKMPGGDRTQLTFFPEPVTGALYEPKDGKYFLFLKDRGGDEFRQIFRADLADGSVTLLSDGGRSQNGNMVWSHAGNRIAYGSTRRNGADRDLYVMDPLQRQSDRRVLEVNGGGWGVEDWSPDDERLLASEGISVNESRLWLVNLANGTKAQVTPEDKEPVAWGNALFHADGRHAYVITDRGEEFAYLGLLDLATKTVKRVSAPRSWDVDDFELTHDGRTIAFTVNEAGLSKLYLLDTSSGAERAVEGVPAGVIGNLGFHPDGTRLAFGVASPRIPSDVYSLEVASGRVERWTNSEVGPVVLDDLPDPEVIRWKSFDEREITGFLYRPAKRFTGKRPVVIIIHGGPEGQAQPTFRGRWNYLLDQLGVAIVEPNVRGSTGYGKTFVKLDNGMQREDSVKDVGALLDWIARSPDLDASRVLIYGGSYGGYMTLAVATHYSDRIRASVDLVGISNFNTFLANTEDYRRDLRRVEYGDERQPEMRAFFERIAPLNNAGKIGKPLFVVQGANDPRVPKTEAEQIVATVRRGQTPVWYLLGLNEGHGFAKKENSDYLFFAVVEFIKKYVLS
ncbi:MAG TPA: prolyl oligopeptidase family serine peptidase [Thermoanaerobaculia bacterium]|nr:prolyl oligopeptidase family serine peptidase [Thermoanaerobaculia bacterium]